MRCAARHVICVASFAVPHVVAGRVAGMFHEPLEQTNSLVTLANQHVPELMRMSERPAGTNRVNKERLRPVKRIDVTRAVSGIDRACSLDRAAHFEGELIEP